MSMRHGASVAVLLAGLAAADAFAGAGKDGASVGKDNPAKPSIPLPEVFRGKWVLDADRLADMPFLKNVPQEKRGQLVGLLKKQLDGIVWEFGPETITMSKGDNVMPAVPLTIDKADDKSADGTAKRPDGRIDPVRFERTDKGFVLQIQTNQVPLKRPADAGAKAEPKSP